MIGRKWRIIAILFAFTILLIMPISTLGASDDVDVWDTKTITDKNKVWTISFNHSIKESSIKNTTVYVEDEQLSFCFY